MQVPVRPRYRSLDLWRGVACLAVVLFHAALYVPGWIESPTAGVYRVLRYGHLGVPVFFVISGYCIAAASDAHRRSSRPSLEFMKRRIRRIYPPCWIMTAGMVALLAGFKVCGSDLLECKPRPLVDISSLTWSQWFGNLTLTDAWLHPSGPESWHYVNGVIWSLCYEEQFYFLCFLVILLASRRLFQALAAITVGVTATWFVAFVSGRGEWLMGTFADFGWWQFACGAGVYWRLNYVTDPGQARRLDRAIFVGAAALLAVCAWLVRFPDTSLSYCATPWLSLAVALGFAMLLILLRPHDDRMADSPVGSVLARVGGFSYSLYLTHVPVCKLVQTVMYRLGFWSPERALLGTIPVIVLLSLLVGWVFYRLVERRFLNPSLSRALAAPSTPPEGAAFERPRPEPAVCVAADERVACAAS